MNCGAISISPRAPTPTPGAVHAGRSGLPGLLQPGAGADGGRPHGGPPDARQPPAKRWNPSRRRSRHEAGRRRNSRRPGLVRQSPAAAKRCAARWQGGSGRESWSRRSAATACATASRWWKWWTPDGAVDFLRQRNAGDGAADRAPPHALRSASGSGASGPNRMPVGAELYLRQQQRIVLENCGEIDPLKIDDYLARDGYQALKRACQELSPAAGDRRDLLIGPARPRRRRLPHRHGSGRSGARRPATVKYVICNGDEGDPGAFMDRAGARIRPAPRAGGPGHRGLRHRRTRAISTSAPSTRWRCSHIRAAIRQARGARRYLGELLHLEVREGAGAFVCGEETALIQSLEGKRGMPRLRPPYPVERGFRGKPTIINNVETLACVPWIIRHGAAAFAACGTADQQGHQGVRAGRQDQPRRADRSAHGHHHPRSRGGDRRRHQERHGGSRRCSSAALPAAASRRGWPTRRSTTMRWPETGAIMGSGGMVVLDDRDCMVDIARFFLKFTQAESCGKCTFCRIGTKRMLEILEQALRRQGQSGRPRKTGGHWPTYVSRGSLCGLGQTAPNPVLTTLRYFREEYEAHLRGALPGRQMRGADSLPRQRQLHRLHAVRAGLPGGRDRVSSVRKARDGRSALHALRYVPPGVPGRRRRGPVN